MGAAEQLKVPKSEPNAMGAAEQLKVPKSEPNAMGAAEQLKVPKLEPNAVGTAEQLEVPKMEPNAMGTAEQLKVPKPEPNAVGAAKQLKVPKLEPLGTREFSPRSVLRGRQLQIDLSSSSSPSSSSSEDESDSESDSDRSYSDSEASSNHSDRSDSEVDYEVDSDADEEDEGRPPRAKKQKIAKAKAKTERSGERRSHKKKSRVKTTAKRADCFSPRQRTSNPGRRVVGRRIYDSYLGRTCHWCRQKTVELHVECSRCPIRFCGQCLLNRNGEDILQETMKNVRWVCPKCRNGCGPGCKNCCNCGPCRKTQNLEPTGQLIQTVRKAGFTNAHDYLVHLKTKEDPEVIAKRKDGRKWTIASGALMADYDVKREEEEDDVKMEVDEDEEDNIPPKAKLRTRASASSHQSNWDNGIKVKGEPEELKCPTVRKEVIRSSRRLITRRGNSDLVPETNVTRRHSGARTADIKNPAEDLLSVDFTQDSANNHGPSSCVEGDEFPRKLEYTLGRPFSTLQLKQMWDHVKFRKPVTKLRQTRNRAIEVQCSTDGQSYLDHYPDLAEKLVKTCKPEEKLRILRGFLFWLQHSCMEGAFKPWATVGNVDDNEECMEISGPECQVIRVLLAVDEDEDSDRTEWEHKKPVVSAEDSKKSMASAEHSRKSMLRSEDSKESVQHAEDIKPTPRELRELRKKAIARPLIVKVKQEKEG